MKSDSNTIIELGYRLYSTNYKPRKVVFKSGKGSVLWDVDGKEYLDLGSGIGVSCMGHQNQEIQQAVQDQLQNLWHTSNFYFSEPPIRLAEKIVERTFAEKVYFCNSGAEANETAIKVARRYAYDRFGPNERQILTFEGSFHGRTMGAITATAQPKYHEGFGPLPEGFKYCKFNDIKALQESFETDDICAVLLEPIQGEGGIRLFSTEFLQEVHRLCQQHQALLIFDEVQCGMGRTGKLFAYEWAENIEPDIVTVAKAFGAGLPIGATLLGHRVSECLPLGSHGSTFGGNAVCCAASQIVFAKVSSPEFLQKISDKGRLIMSLLHQTNSKLNIFREIRGKGMMIGAEFNEETGAMAPQVMTECLKHQLLVLQSGNSVIRLLPAFTIKNNEIKKAMKILDRVLTQTVSKV